MRERTALPAAILDRLPELKLLITTGMGNVAIDIAAAQRNGVVVCGTGMHGPATAELDLGPDPRPAAQDPRRGRRDARAAAGRRRSAATSRAPRSAWSGSAGSASGWSRSPRPSAWRCSPGASNLDPEAARAAGAEPVEQGRALRALRLRLGPLQAERAQPRPGRRRRARRDEAERLPGQHLARADRRHRRAGRGARGGDDRRRRHRRLRHRAAARRPPAAQRPAHRSSPRTSATSPRTPTRSSSTTRSRTCSPISTARRSASSRADAPAPARRYSVPATVRDVGRDGLDFFGVEDAFLPKAGIAAAAVDRPGVRPSPGRVRVRRGSGRLRRWSRPL